MQPIEQKLPFKQLSHNRITKAQTAIFRSPATQRRQRHRSSFGANEIDGFID
jgi:hypothetical protein